MKYVWFNNAKRKLQKFDRALDEAYFGTMQLPKSASSINAEVTKEAV